MKGAGRADATPAAREFDAHRRFLWGLCYRMTGSAADADDLVQETYLKALERRPSEREHGWRPWLTRVATNLAIDSLRRRRRRRYVGPWLPAPVETGEKSVLPSYEVSSPELSTEARYDLMESVSFAFLLALERLTPRQRAVLLLRDVFDYDVLETARALAMTQGNAKVTHLRARRVMSAYDGRRTPAARDRRAGDAAKLQEFLGHLERRDVAAIEAMLAADARFVSDGGGEFQAALQIVRGPDRVARLLFGLAAKRGEVRADLREINGQPAVVAEVVAPDRWAPRWVFRLEVGEDGLVHEVQTMLAPSKLTAIAPVGKGQAG
ncbi:MAG: sigma-70 family RNA polymerase sigma factor [Acidimicrobiia bacterium]|nr:sigma-70 family RNA polymerase sigma factor [Acidimicrobiia bacterium]